MRRAVLALVLAFSLGAASAVSAMAGAGQAHWRVALDFEPFRVELSAQGVRVGFDWVKERA